MLKLKDSGGLVLTRKPGECVRITVPPGAAEQTIFIGLDHSANRASRLRIIANDEVVILRTELLDEQPEPPLVAEAATAL